MSTQPETLTLLFVPSAEVFKNYVTPLHGAISLQDIAQVKKCLEEHIAKKSLDEVLKVQDEKGRTPFALVCDGLGNQAIFELLLNVMKEHHFEIKDKSKRNVLMLAIKHLPEVQCLQLLDKVPSLLADQDANENNVFMLALKRNYKKLAVHILRIIKHVSKNKTEFNSYVQIKNNQMQDAFYFAIRAGNFQMADYLLKFGAEIEGRDKNGNTRLMHAMVHLGDDRVQYLKKRGAKLNQVNTAGDTSLLQAMKKGNYDIARYLLEQGEDGSIKDSHGKCYIDILLQAENKPEKERFLKFINSPPKFTHPIDYPKMFMEAITSGDKDTVAYCVNAVNPDYLSKTYQYKRTFLHIACELGHLELVKFYITEKNMSFEKTDELGYTPLLLAAENGHLEVVKFLIEKGANYDRENINKDTALSLAHAKNKKTVFDFIYQIKAEKTRQEELRTLKLPEGKMERDSFVTKVALDEKTTVEVIATKGLAVLSHYFANKDASHYRGYVADSLEAFKHGLSLLKNAKSGSEYGLLYAVKGHMIAIKCEKIGDENHVIVMDSLGSSNVNLNILFTNGTFNHADTLASIASEVFSDQSDRTFVYLNKEHRQNDGEICTGFATKDLRKMLKSESLSLELHRFKHILKTDYIGVMTVYTFRTPPRFMRLAQSPKVLQEYLEANPELCKEKIRLNKNLEFENFVQYALCPRDRYAVKTPEKAANRDYDFSDPKSSKYVYKNHTARYFTSKYIFVLDKCLARFPDLELRNIIKHYNAANLKIAEDGSVMTASQEHLQNLNRVKAENRLIIKELEKKSRFEKSLEERPVNKRKIARRSLKELNLTRDQVEEVMEYLETEKNPIDAQFFAPAFLFSHDAMLKFKFDEKAYVQEIADEMSGRKRLTREEPEKEEFTISQPLAKRARQS